MAHQSLFCPFCGAEQIKPNARFCHVCGQALPLRSAPVAASPAPAVITRQRSRLRLLPLILAIAVMAAAVVVWPRGLLNLGGRDQNARTTGVISERAAGASATPGDAGGARDVATPAAGLPEATVVPPSGTLPPLAAATPQATATPWPTATPPPTATPSPTATPVPTSTHMATATLTPVVGKVVFGSDRSGFAHIFTTRGNGQGLRVITSGNEYFWDPIFSNDGTLVAFVSKVSGNTEVFVARSDGSNARAISNHPAEDDHPAWFPRNSELAFASRRDGGWDIYRMNADGSNVRRLTADGDDNRFVAVSPDGAQIAYVSQNAGYPGLDLMLMNADGSNRRALFSFVSTKQRDDPGRYVFRPDWSPDGAQLAFGADEDNDGLISIIVLDAATGQAQRLIEDGNSPAWSPDGGRLIYKPAGEPQILFVADVNGRRLYQLTAPAYNAWSPDWAR